MVAPPLTEAAVWTWLADVPDPEIPVISVVELGIIRDVTCDGAHVRITLTPTYSGCPATSVIARDIEAALKAHGVTELSLDTQLSPPWTTDWLSDAAHKKLKAYGIAPPRSPSGPDRCPRCAATDLERISQFGSTPCKAQWRCRSCLEPFDFFKCI